jgi:hypothetical protein
MIPTSAVTPSFASRTKRRPSRGDRARHREFDELGGAHVGAKVGDGSCVDLGCTLSRPRRRFAARAVGCLDRHGRSGGFLAVRLGLKL